MVPLGSLDSKLSPKPKFNWIAAIGAKEMDWPPYAMPVFTDSIGWESFRS